MSKLLPKLMICGYGRHGKDTVCEMMEPWSFMSSSIFVAEVAVYPELKELYGYTSVLECYEDRHNHRQEWHELIKAYNLNDRARLARELYAAYDIYCGIRCREEFAVAKAKGLFVLSVWIDASERLPPESTDSCTVTKDMCDIVLENNGTLQELEEKVSRLKICLLGGTL